MYEYIRLLAGFLPSAHVDQTAQESGGRKMFNERKWDVVAGSAEG